MYIDEGSNIFLFSVCNVPKVLIRAAQIHTTSTIMQVNPIQREPKGGRE